MSSYLAKFFSSLSSTETNEKPAEKPAEIISEPEDNVVIPESQQETNTNETVLTKLQQIESMIESGATVRQKEIADLITKVQNEKDSAIERFDLLTERLELALETNATLAQSKMVYLSLDSNTLSKLKMICAYLQNMSIAKKANEFASHGASLVGTKRKSETQKPSGRETAQRKVYTVPCEGNCHKN